jgi:glutathione peroxidase
MLSLLAGYILTALTSFYSLNFQSTDGATINMSQFEGKKVLIVNIATGSDKAGQLVALQQLQQQYSDSLVVIAFPSNSFAHETRTDTEIKLFCQEQFSATFLIAAKSSVSGTGINPVFSWLADKTKNGEMDALTGGDFQKFLVDKDGMLIGVFSPKVSPMDTELTAAITRNF